MRKADEHPQVDRGDDVAAKVHHPHDRRPARGHLGEGDDVLDLLDPLDGKRIALPGEVEGDDLLDPVAAGAVRTALRVGVWLCVVDGGLGRGLGRRIRVRCYDVVLLLARHVFLLREPQHPVEFLRAHQTFLHFVESCLRHVAHACGTRDRAQFLRAGRARNSGPNRLGER